MHYFIKNKEIHYFYSLPLSDLIPGRAVRRCRRAAAAGILLTPPPPIITDRLIAAADHMSASHRRRFRGVFTSCRTPAIMSLDLCNAVYNEA